MTESERGFDYDGVVADSEGMNDPRGRGRNIDDIRGAGGAGGYRDGDRGAGGYRDCDRGAGGCRYGDGGTGGILLIHVDSLAIEPWVCILSDGVPNLPRPVRVELVCSSWWVYEEEMRVSYSSIDPS